jgi:hypothetical protein
MESIEELKKKQRYVKRYGMYAYIRKYGTECTFFPGTDLLDVVLGLELFRRQGRTEIFTKFNGHYLYSLDETIDSATRKVFKMSRKSYLEKLRRDKCWAEAIEAQNKLEKSKTRKLEKNR